MRFDHENDRAVGEEHFVADAHPAREIGDRRGDAVLVAFDVGGGEHDGRVDAQLDLVVHDGAGAQFGAGQVDEHADRAVQGGRRGARVLGLIDVFRGGAVRGVEPHDVDARVDQCLQRIGLRRCRADRRHDLGSPHVTSVFSIHRPQRALGEPPGREATGSVVLMDRIVVSGLRVMGVHGVLPEEQERPQPFGVELELLVDLAPAGASDALADTVDYGTLIEAVSRIVSDEHHQLIERLATRIAEVCRADDRVNGVVVEVRKLEPPVKSDVQHVAVRIER